MYSSPPFISRTAGLMACILGLGVLSGWFLHIDWLQSVIPGLTSMKPNTAAGFLLCGLSAGLLTVQSERIRIWLGCGSAGFVFVFAALTVSQYLFQTDFGIDNLLTKVPPGASYNDQHPARMTPQAAGIFLILSAAIMALTLLPQQLQAWVQYAVLACSGIPLLTVVGYLFGIHTLPFIGHYKPMALHTSLGFIFVGTAILSATSKTGLLAKFSRKIPVIALSLAMLLLLLSFIAASINSQRASASNAQQLKMHRALWLLEKIATDVERSMAASYDLALTGKDSYRQQMAASDSRLAIGLNEIRRTALPEQTADLSALDALLTEKNRLSQNIGLMRQQLGFQAAAAELYNGNDRVAEQIRIRLDSLINTEQQTLARLEEQVDTDKNNTLIALSITLLTCFGLISGSIAALKRQTDQRKLAEDERARLISIIEATTDLVSTANPEGRISYLNRAGKAMLGLGDQPYDALQISDLHPAWANKLIFEQGIPATRQTGCWQGETALLRRDGREIPISQVILAHRDTQGQIAYLSTVMRDISALKHAQTALAESEQRYRLLTEYAPEAIWVIDGKSGYFVDANSNALQLFGLPREQLCQHSPTTVSPVKQADGRFSAEAALEKQQQALAGGTQVFEWLYLNTSGQTIPCEVRLLRMHWEGRNLLRGSVTDISERKNAEKALRIRDNALKTALNAMAMADLAGDLFYANDAFLKLWAFRDRGQVLGKPARAFWNEPEQIQQIVTELSQGLPYWRGELTAIRKTGELFETDVSASISYENDGRPAAILLSCSPAWIPPKPNASTPNCNVSKPRWI